MCTIIFSKLLNFRGICLVTFELRVYFQKKKYLSSEFTFKKKYLSWVFKFTILTPNLCARLVCEKSAAGQGISTSPQMISSNVHLQKLTAMSLSAREQMDKATLLARVVFQLKWRTWRGKPLKPDSHCPSQQRPTASPSTATRAPPPPARGGWRRTSGLHHLRWKALLQFIRVNIYVESILLTIRTLRHLYVNKFWIKIFLKVQKPKPLLHKNKW